MRKDLSMRKGKMIAQGAHASLGALLKYFEKTSFIGPDRGPVHNMCSYPQKEYNLEHDSFEFTCTFDRESMLDGWLNGPFTKICLGVDSEEEIHEIGRQCAEANIPYAIITDAGNTEFHGVPTVTCIGIGPYWNEEIDKITGHLQLL